MHIHVHVGVLCCFALFVCLTLLASFFLPSHLSFKNMYMYTQLQDMYKCTYILASEINLHNKPSVSMTAMHSQGYSNWSVCVCLFVCLSTAILAAYERYQQLQCYKGMKNNVGDFAETTALQRYGVKTSEKANMHNQHWLTSTRFSPFSTPWMN